MRIVLESTLEHMAASENSTHLSFGPICDGGMTAGLRLDINVRPIHDIRTSFIGKPCRIVVEFDEPDAPPAVIPSESVNPLDEGWRVLTAAMEKRGFVRMPFDGTRVVKFVERDASSATSMPRWVTVSDEYAAHFSGASGADVDSLLSAMGIQ